MTFRAPSYFWIISAGVVTLCAAVAAQVGHVAGLEGFALGVAGSLFNIAALWAVIRLMANLIHAPKPERRGTIIVVAAFLIKIPLFLALAVLAHHIGGPSLGCFLAGVALVYFALVGWMLAAR